MKRNIIVFLVAFGLFTMACDIRESNAQTKIVKSQPAVSKNGKSADGKAVLKRRLEVFVKGALLNHVGRILAPDSQWSHTVAEEALRQLQLQGERQTLTIDIPPIELPPIVLDTGFGGGDGAAGCMCHGGCSHINSRREDGGCSCDPPGCGQCPSC